MTITQHLFELSLSLVQALFNFHSDPEIGFHFLAILLMSLKKVKMLVQGHKVSKWQSRDSNPAVVAKILALCVPMPNRNTEAELWRRKKEWLYFFARQRGNTVG